MFKVLKNLVLLASFFAVSLATASSPKESLTLSITIPKEDQGAFESKTTLSVSVNPQDICHLKQSFDNGDPQKDSPLFQLPEEILQGIFLYFDKRSLLSMARVCKASYATLQIMMPPDNKRGEKVSQILSDWGFREAFACFFSKPAYSSLFFQLVPFLRQNHLPFTKEEFQRTYQTVTDALKKLENGKKELDLGKRGLVFIPPCMGECTDLKYLDLSDNQITFFPEFIKDFKVLEGLWINNNQLTTLALEDFPKLKLLSLKENKLTTLTLTNLPNLDELSLEDNQFTHITVKNLPGLSSLSLERNQLTALTLENLPKLEQLYLSQNQLTAIDLATSAIANLYTLFLLKNPLSEKMKQQLERKRKASRNLFLSY
jgi:hypothetical protein